MTIHWTVNMIHTQRPSPEWDTQRCHESIAVGVCRFQLQQHQQLEQHAVDLPRGPNVRQYSSNTLSHGMRVRSGVVQINTC